MFYNGSHSDVPLCSGGAAILAARVADYAGKMPTPPGLIQLRTVLSTGRRKYAASLLGLLLGSFPPCGGRSGWGVPGRGRGCSPPPWSSPSTGEERKREPL